jgi:hypothetical protein
MKFQKLKVFLGGVGVRELGQLTAELIRSSDTIKNMLRGMW